MTDIGPPPPSYVPSLPPRPDQSQAQMEAVDLLALIFALLGGGIIAVILGMIGRNRAATRNMRQHAIGTVGLVLGVIESVAWILFWIIVLTATAHPTQGLGAAQQEQQAQAQTANAQGILAQIDQPGGKRAVLDAPNGAPVAGVLVYGGQRQVVTVSLPPNNVGRAIYVLWGIGDGRPIPVGSFDIASGDHSLHAVGDPLPAVGPFPSYAISIEYGRRAPETPGLVVATGQVAN
jgi:hypothetical protein